jgi:lysophospholipid acyltransferase (LPLAT)-like uncharacterized protein
MTGLIAAGHPGGLALDASTGPPYIAKSGIVRLAGEAGAAIVPMVWFAAPCWRLKSWLRRRLAARFSECARSSWHLGRRP